LKLADSALISHNLGHAPDMRCSLGGVRISLGRIQRWLDEETLQMLVEWSSATSELERKRQHWRISRPSHPTDFFEAT
jgi:hypothetical protein